jgi:cell division protein ZapE
MPNTPLARYNRLIEQCEIRPDLMQRAMVLKLQRLYDTITEPDFFMAQRAGSGKLLSGLFSRRKHVQPDVKRPYGIYLWGDVGRGKSMLMDVFYHSLPITQTKRLHFLQFMLDVHGRIHQYRKQELAGDPILQVASDIASECHVLCFDEFQVHDITDAMILSRLFTALFNAGMVVVFTSNRPPEALYLGGLQREKFLPFIDLLRERVQIEELASQQDYRLGRMEAIQETYKVATGEVATYFLDEVFATLSHHEAAVAMDIPVQGRVLRLEQTCRDMVRLSFAELCAKPLGALDYMALTALFKTFLIDDIPQLTPENRNEAKRFVTLIDVLYEAHAVLICTAASSPQELYVHGEGQFEFGRTVSRLMQMQSASWLT